MTRAKVPGETVRRRQRISNSGTEASSRSNATHIVPNQLCPICGYRNARLLIDRWNVPVMCNSLLRSADEAKQVPRGRLQLVACQHCALVYNAAFDPQHVNYTAQYENAQHFSEHFRNYLEAQANQLVERYHIRDKRILEIGCGDGRFLQLICAAGRNQGVGFDPAAAKGASLENQRVKIIPTRFDGTSGHQADFVICRHVLEHVYQPIDFMQEVWSAASPSAKARVYFEVPNIASMLRDHNGWEALYEHCLYFGKASLTALFTRCGFEVLDSWESFEGQFLSVVAIPTRLPQIRIDAAEVAVQLEQTSRFPLEFYRLLTLWNRRLKRFDEQGKRIFIWGGGTRGVMFLNSTSAGRCVRGVIDVNPRKWGYFTAGTGQQIYSPSELRRLKPDVVIAMNRAYEHEIKAELKRSGCAARYVPIT